MDFLNRDQYNQEIRKLNRDSKMQDMALNMLTDWYERLFCYLSDYEEIVMLINICIAEDRENRLEELYENYSRLQKMLDMHGDYAIADYDLVVYCMGVFSFKFHDYKMAIQYFKKCEEQILIQFPSPCSSIKSDIYIKVKVLMSYSMEYELYLNQGPLNAINNILDDPLDITKEFEVQLINDISNHSKEIVSQFFQRYHSHIYEMASEPMKKEVLHLFAHCFSEYANNLKANKNNDEDYKKIYLFEKLANSFISMLGPEMITCKAIISSEHGHYWSALEEMESQYQSLPQSEEKKKAELAFYIYYFSNQIGLDHNKRVEDYKNFFLDYASKENGDTKVYAWIVQFREKLAEALQAKGEEVQKLLDLEEFIKQAKSIDANQGYLHPQILREKNRLLLAYQILRSYLAINERDTYNQDIDNSLFEKCVLFSKQNSIDKMVEIIDPDWSRSELLIELHHVRLCVVGLRKEIHSQLEKEFCTKIPICSTSSIQDRKVVICASDNQLSALSKMEKSHLILFIYCSDNYRSKIREIVDENVCVETDLIKIFKVAYIQEILDQCYQFSYRWDEFFIMAPITDNSTFSFQNQGIENFLEIKNHELDEIELFSEDNGYVTNEFGSQTIVQPIPCDISIIEEVASITRAFYFTGNCLYCYRMDNREFTPHKILRNLDGLKETAHKLHRITRKKDKTMRACGCKLTSKHCLCDEWSVQNPDVYEFLMRFSVTMPDENEHYCILVWSEKKRDANSLEDFLLFMSNKVIKSYSLRELLKNLPDISKTAEQDNSIRLNTQHSKNTEILQELFDEIERYKHKNAKMWPEGSNDYKKTVSLQEKIQTAINKGQIDKYEEFRLQWDRIINSNPF